MCYLLWRDALRRSESFFPKMDNENSQRNLLQLLIDTKSKQVAQMYIFIFSIVHIQSQIRGIPSINSREF